MDFSPLYDPLFCQEVHFEGEEHYVESKEEEEEEEDDEWLEALSSLLASEAETHPELSVVAAGDVYLVPARTNAVEWVTKTSIRHGFSAQTMLLAVNYLDRCFLAGGMRLQEDKPWMARLAAVACLSLAAKVEETRVPLLLDLQVPQSPAGEDMGYVFENRTIRRMELLLLSTLGWRMNPVTPLSLARRLLRKIPPTSGRRRAELFRRCEAALSAVVADLGWVRHPPSVWAAAAMLYAATTTPADNASVDIPLDLLNVSKERVGCAYQLILEQTSTGIKRKQHYNQCSCCSLCFYSSPGSPNCVVSSCFTCENSSSSESPFKKQNANPITDSGESNDLVIEHGFLLA